MPAVGVGPGATCSNFIRFAYVWRLLAVCLCRAHRNSVQLLRGTRCGCVSVNVPLPMRKCRTQ